MDDSRVVRREKPRHGSRLGASGYHRRCNRSATPLLFSGRCDVLLAILATRHKGVSMPAYGWGGDIGLEQWLFDEPHAFDFFQAVHLLELWSQREAGPRSETAAEPSDSEPRSA